MGIGPYVQQPYRRDTSRITALLRDRGDITAGGERERGAISARTWAGVGDTVADAVQQYARYKADEPARTHQKKAIARQEQDWSREDNLTGLFQKIGQMNPDDAADLLRTEGYPNEASKLEQAAAQRRKKLLDDQAKLSDLGEKGITAATRLLSTVQSGPPETAPQRYESVLGDVRQMVGPRLGKLLPDSYDPRAVNGALQWGMTAAQVAQQQRDIARDAAAKLAAGEKQREVGIELLGKWAGTVNTQSDWDDMRTRAAAFGVPKDLIDAAGETYSPDAVGLLQALGGAKDETLPGTFGDYVERLARDRGVSPDQLPTAQVESARRTWASLARAPEKAGGGTSERPRSLSPESYATAVRWKDERLASLEQAYREARGRITPEEHEAAKARIQTSFEDQVKGAVPPPAPSDAPRMGNMGRPGRTPQPSKPLSSNAPPVGFRRPEPPPNASEAPSDDLTIMLEGWTQPMRFNSRQELDAFLREAGLTRR